VSIEARKQVQVFPGRKSAARATSLDREESSAAESEARADRSHLRQLEHFKSGTFYSSLVRKPRHVRVQSCRGSRPASQTASRSDAAQKVDLIISKIDLLTGENDRVRKAVDQAASSWRKFGEALQVKEKIFREYALDGRELA
jgi:hypothetical protein